MNENEFDLEKFDADFEQEWNEQGEQNEEVETEVTVDETETENEVEEEETEELDETETNPEEEPETIHDPDADKRNKAFADLRRQADENKKYADFIQQLAAQSNTTPEEILNRYQEKQLAAEAEKQGVPVDVYKRLTELEKRDVQREEEVFSERFDNEVNSVIEKENLKEADVENVFKYMAENGLINDGKPLIGFDKAYKLANLDTIVEKSKKEAVQTNLEQKRKRQLSSALPTGATTTQTDNDIDEQVARDVKALLDTF